MAVPGYEKRTRLCERCFANVPIELSTCPECGADMPSDKAIEGTDAAIYPELSRANLLRMRGDYRGAEEQCLAILKRYPNNATVHTLLGDIYAEQNDLEQAAQWYELALDLKPDSASDRQKLAAIHERRRIRESANSVESLGLPPNRQNTSLFAVLAIVAIVVVGFVAYLIGEGSHANGQSKIIAPVSAPESADDTSAAPAPLADDTPPSYPRDPQVDRELRAMVQQRSPASGNLVTLLSDPRSHIVFVTYNVGPNEDEKRIGAELARTVLDQSEDTLVVTLRAVRDDKVSYMADVPRSRYLDLQTGAYNSPPEAWINHIVTNEWPSQEPAPSGPAPTTNPPNGNSGTTSQPTPPPTNSLPEFSPPLDTK